MFLCAARPLIYILVDDDRCIETEDLARYLIELSVFNTDIFTHTKPSSLAYAAMITAMDILGMSNNDFLDCRLTHEPSMTKLCV